MDGNKPLLKKFSTSLRTSYSSRCAEKHGSKFFNFRRLRTNEMGRKKEVCLSPARTRRSEERRWFNRSMCICAHGIKLDGGSGWWLWWTWLTAKRRQQHAAVKSHLCPKFRQHSRDTLLQAQTTQTSDSPTNTHSKSTKCWFFSFLSCIFICWCTERHGHVA